MDMSFGLCSQCGLSHPPLKPGEKCPMAKEKDLSGSEIRFDNFFVTLKNILNSQIQLKKIKDSDKLLAFTLIEITKILEAYKE